MIEYKKTKEHSSKLDPNGLFVLETHNGSIKLIGTEKNSCEVTATVSAKATTEEESKQLTEKVKVGLESDGKKLFVKIEKPVLSANQSIQIDFNVKIPMETALELTCHNGTIHVSNIGKEINGTVHNGSIFVKKFFGKELRLDTHNGSIGIELIENNYNKFDLSAKTHNGNILLNIPPNLSAKIKMASSNGSVYSNIPMIITKKTNNELQGVTETGEGDINLITHNGSIEIKLLSKRRTLQF